jgi:hypothetical protein
MSFLLKGCIMLKMNTVKGILTASALALVVGCSNINSPVAVSEDNETTVATLVGDSPSCLDVVSAGPTMIWALSENQVSGYSGNYYIYKYFPSNNSWANTNHWGMLLTVSNSGICYHANNVNDAYSIWCAVDIGNGVQIPNESDLTSILDITVSNLYSGCDQLWVLGKNGSSEPFVRRCTVTYTINATNPPTVTINSVTWDMANPVYIPSPSDYRPFKVARDPSSSSYAVMIYEYKYSPTHRILFGTNNSGYTWSQQNITQSMPQDAAVCGTNVVFTFWGDISWICRGTLNGAYPTNNGLMTARACAIDKNGSSYYVYTLDGNYKVDRNPY